MKRSPTRVLHVFASLDRGGAEALVMAMYRSIERAECQFDFVVNEHDHPYAHEREIQEMGGRIFYLPRLTLTNLGRYWKAWRQLLMEHPEWRVIHAHHTSPGFLFIPLAHRFRRVVVAHSHTAGASFSAKDTIKRVARFPIRYSADYLFACGDMAARWMFGQYAGRARIVPNATDTHAFAFDELVRAEVRAGLGLGGKLALGHVGRIAPPKNHSFLLNIFAHVKRLRSDAVLILVGDGPDADKIRREIVAAGLTEDVLMLGVRADVAQLMQAFDVFIMPSLFEGFPVTLIEAQASGLPCVIADTITDEVCVTDTVTRLSLQKPAEVWAEEVLKVAREPQRAGSSTLVAQAGFDAAENARWLQEFYKRAGGSVEQEKNV